ncbi:MAG: ion channel [Porticoccaceae bacterium]
MDGIGLIFLFNSAVVGIAVLIHYEALYRLALWLPKLGIAPRFRVLCGILGAFIAHVVEIWLFAFAYYLLLAWDGMGALGGNFNGSILDCSYFSFSNYTSLGYGDIEPFGNIRFLSVLETLTGLILIGWTASFMYIEMQKFWVPGKSKS